MRLDPVVAGLFRFAAQDIQLGGYAVPKVGRMAKQAKFINLGPTLFVSCCSCMCVHGVFHE